MACTLHTISHDFINRKLDHANRALSTSFFNPPSRIPFAGMILVDPPMWGTEKEGQFSDMYKMVEMMTPIRRDTWKSHEAAVKWMRTSLPCDMWDARVLDTYIVSL